MGIIIITDIVGKKYLINMINLGEKVSGGRGRGGLGDGGFFRV